MNNTRRSQLKSISKKLSASNITVGELEQIKDAIEDIASEEEDARENMPESLQDSDRYYKSEEAGEHMEDAVSNIESAIEYAEQNEDSKVIAEIEDAISNINSACF